MAYTATAPAFALGRLVATPAVLEAVPRKELFQALGRHLTCDWGDLTDADKRRNENALRHGDRLISVHRSENGTRFWIITEADRSATTVLLPEDY